jgi:hypothetical protein
MTGATYGVLSPHVWLGIDFIEFGTKNVEIGAILVLRPFLLVIFAP